MFAIIEIGGEQIKVLQGGTYVINNLPEKKVGEIFNIDKVLLFNNEGTVKIGEPYLQDVIVTARVLDHFKGEKVLVFKKKRRKGYRKLNGHRQRLTKILIEEIKF